MWVRPEIFLGVFYDNLCWLGSVGGYPPHIYHHIFWQYVGQYVGPIFSWEKINEYFWYHPEIFLGLFYDNLCYLGRAAGAMNANYLTC